MLLRQKKNDGNITDDDFEPLLQKYFLNNLRTYGSGHEAEAVLLPGFAIIW